MKKNAGFFTPLAILLAFLTTIIVFSIAHSVLSGERTIRNHLSAMQRHYNERVAVVRIIEGMRRNPSFVPPATYEDLGVSATVTGTMHTTDR